MAGSREHSIYRPLGKGQTVNSGGVSAVTAKAIGTDIAVDYRGTCVGVLLVATTDCWVEIGPQGATTAAVDTSTWLPAYVPMYFSAHADDVVAVLQDTTAGKLRVRPVGFV